MLTKFREDKDSKRLKRSEVVLKKFGLLDRDFQLQPFLVSLLTEQIAGYYDSKTKTVNLLDWIAPDQQKPVLAHELTHALQDQHVDLEKWGSQSSDTIAQNVTEDNQHLATDEADTARDAVAEGQAMAVFLDYDLKPLGKSLKTEPNIASQLGDEMDDPHGSPVLARAPLLLKDSLLFPYREGLSFEQAVLKDEGTASAFAGVLDRPPATSFEIMNPRAYETKQPVPLLHMPDVHGLLNAEYEPYDVGVLGEFDVRVLTGLFGGTDAAATLTPQWNGGIYYAAQSRQAKSPEQKVDTASLALVYLSQWTSGVAAATFADLYAKDLNKKYTRVERRPEEESSPTPEAAERVWDTNEGPVLIAINGKQVFISESFALPLARRLELLLCGAQAGEGTQFAEKRAPSQNLSGGLVKLLGDFGMMRVALRH